MKCAAIAVLAAALGAGLAPAQGPTLGPLTLELTDSNGQPVTSEEPVAKLLVTAHGTEGAWVYVFAHAWVDVPPYDPEGPPELLDFYAGGFADWLAPLDVDTGGTIGGIQLVSGSPTMLAVDEEQVVVFLARCMANNDPDRVRSFAQPILEGGSTAVPLAWNAQAETWLGNQAPEGGVTLARKWTDALAYGISQGGVYTDTWTYNTELLFSAAVTRQAPDPEAAAIFHDTWLNIAANWGLRLDLQALAIIDPYGQPGPTAGTTDGLVSLPDSPLGVLSELRRIEPLLSSPLPLGGSGMMVGAFTIEPLGYAGIGLLLPMIGFSPPLSVQVQVGNRTGVLAGGFYDVGLAVFPLPATVGEGAVVEILSITNGIGTTVVSNPGWDAIPIEPAPFP